MSAAIADEREALRADIYALLAALLRGAPRPELLAFVAAIEVDDDPASDSARDIAGAWKALAEAAAANDPAALEDEFQAVFIGVTQGETTPFASWYDGGELCGAPLVAVREDLAELGLARSDHGGEPEDHIACLCEAMSLLARAGAPAQGQAAFFERHLAPWAPQFFDDLAAAPSARFYRAVADLARAFVEQECSLNRSAMNRPLVRSHKGGAT